jgi:TonB family protein
MKNYLLAISILLLPVLLKAQAGADTAGTNAVKATSGVVLPTFPDGLPGWTSFLRHNIRYPASAHENHIQGKVLIEFIVEEDGSLTNFNTLNSPSDDLTTESLRVLALSPKWNPGTKDGKPVRVKYKVPINFTLSPPPLQKLPGN